MRLQDALVSCLKGQPSCRGEVVLLRKLPIGRLLSWLTCASWGLRLRVPPLPPCGFSISSLSDQGHGHAYQPSHLHTGSKHLLLKHSDVVDWNSGHATCIFPVRFLFHLLSGQRHKCIDMAIKIPPDQPLFKLLDENYSFALVVNPASTSAYSSSSTSLYIFTV